LEITAKDIINVSEAVGSDLKGVSGVPSARADSASNQLAFMRHAVKSGCHFIFVYTNSNILVNKPGPGLGLLH